MLKSLQLNIFHYILCKLPLPAPPLWGKNPCQEPNLPESKLNCDKAGYGILSNISPGLFQNKRRKKEALTLSHSTERARVKAAVMLHSSYRSPVPFRH